MTNKKNTSSTIFNPFTGRNAGNVWNEIRENSKPVSREEAFRKMQLLKESSKK